MLHKKHEKPLTTLPSTPPSIPVEWFPTFHIPCHIKPMPLVTATGYICMHYAITIISLAYTSTRVADGRCDEMNCCISVKGGATGSYDIQQPHPPDDLPG